MLAILSANRREDIKRYYSHLLYHNIQNGSMEQLRTREPYLSINIVHNLWKGVAGKRNLTKLAGSLPIHQDREKIQKLVHILERSTRVISHKVGAISWMVRWLFTFKSKFNLPGSGSAIQMAAANILSAHGGSKFNNPFWDIKPFGVSSFFLFLYQVSFAPFVVRY
jgi:hypothetical protein